VRGWIRFSVISFMMLYLLLGCGELYLRRNPLLVGGGGGGNPALKQIYAGLYTANSLGLRGPEVEPSKSAGTRRLLMLGDSFTFGQGVRDGEVYPRIVESNLRTEAASAGNWEVVNAGNAGKDMTYHWRFLEERGWRLQPDLITVQFFANDLEPQEVAESGGGSRGEPWWARIIAWPYRTSYAVFFSKYRFQQLLTRLDPDAAGKYSLDGWYRQLLRELQRNGPGWQSFCRHSRAIQASARRHDVPLIFFLFPHAGVPSPRESLLLQGVESFLIGEGIEVVNLDGMWQNLSPEEQVVSPIDNHPSAAAHRVAAARILAALRARQLVPSAP
jgi:hypothetical protein